MSMTSIEVPVVAENAMQAAMQRALGHIGESPAKPLAVAAKVETSTSTATETKVREPATRIQALGGSAVQVPTPKGVIHLAKPPIDKVAAHALLERANTNESEVVVLPVLGFYANKSCDNSRMINWIESGIWPIDIGQEKYNQTKFSSTYEMTLSFLGKDPSPAEERLKKLIAENNRTGHLKKGENRVAQMIRDFYELPEIDSKEVIERTKDVVFAWIQRNEEVVTDPCYIDLEGLFPGISEPKNCPPLSLLDYIRNLYALGFETEKLVRRWNWWKERQLWVQAVKQEAVAEFKEKGTVTHWTKGKGVDGTLRVGVIETDNNFVTEIAMATFRDKRRPSHQKPHLLVVRKSDGLTSIFRIHFGLVMDPLRDGLMEAEPDSWYPYMNGNVMLNGSVQYEESKATKFSTEELVAFIGENSPVFR